ncbi:MAG: PorV/PorQ family protein, partial [Minisyncoccia bacterium]
MQNSLKIAAIVLLISIGFTTKGLAQAGAAAVPFLQIAPDARAGAMGEAGTAIADDINAIYWNPGGLAFLDYFEAPYGFENQEPNDYRQFALSFTPWLPQFNADLYYAYATYGQHIEELNGTVAANFILMNLGEFIRTASDGRELGRFISNEFSLGLSYGTIIAPDLGAGIQVRYIQSNLTPTGLQSSGDAGIGRSVSFDVGFLWKPIDLGPLEDRLALGLNLQNLGPRITYVSQADPLPTMLKLCVAYKLFEDEFNKITVTADAAKLMVNRDSLGSDPLPQSLITAWENRGAEFAFGMEYWYQDIIAFRGGYFT